VRHEISVQSLYKSFQDLISSPNSVLLFYIKYVGYAYHGYKAVFDVFFMSDFLYLFYDGVRVERVCVLIYQRRLEAFIYHVKYIVYIDKNKEQQQNKVIIFHMENGKNADID
jgi:hypothetical protein